MDKNIRATIIGGGSIGALKPDQFDNMELAKKGIALTHASAYMINPDFELVSICDISTDKAIIARSKWGGIGITNSIKQTIEIDRPQVVSICVDTEYHLQVIKEIACCVWTPRLIILEKPGCMNDTELWEADKLCHTRGIKVLINYSRLFLPTTHQIYMNIQNTEFLPVYHARLMYGRGLLRDGCHAISLFNHLFGRMIKVTAQTEVIESDNHVEQNVRTFHMEYEHCHSVLLAGIDSGVFDAFEFDMYAAGLGHLQWSNHGLWARLKPIEMEKVYGNYPSLSSNESLVRTELDKALMYMLHHAIRIIRGEEEPYCNINDGAAVHRILKVMEGLK